MRPVFRATFGKRFNKTFATLLVFLLGSLGSARAQGRIDCAALNSKILKQVVHYCVYLPASYSAPVATPAKGPAALYPVLYFLHGLGGERAERCLDYRNSGRTRQRGAIRRSHGRSLKRSLRRSHRRRALER